MQKLPLPIFPLKQWFCHFKRDLPWRNNPTPYAVWVSEVMLQQTQVAVVIGYFERWMRRFPTIEHLATASLEEVIKLWEGLGYYSRARSLHQGVQYVVQRHGGILPCSAEALQQIPGIGPYTVGAILSFAFRQKAAAVDGNVTRVLTRFAGIEEDISSSRVKKWIWDYAQDLLPDEEPWLVVEGLIELGATVCTRQPKCSQCPLSSSCLGLKKGIADLLPINRKKKEITLLYRQVAVIKWKEFYLLRKGEKGSLMADLYEFPYFEGLDRGLVSELLSETFNLSATFVEDLPEVQHHFTRYRAILSPSLWEVSENIEVENYLWIDRFSMEELPFSAGHKKIFNTLKDRYADITY